MSSNAPNSTIPPFDFPAVVRHLGELRWEGVEVRPYKEDGGNTFRTVTRQTLFHGEHDLPVEFRYFEVGEGGHSTLERHEHSHFVMVAKGGGEVLVGEEITAIDMFDVVRIPPLTWHQFRASRGTDLGFVCLVNAERDRPQRPDEDQLSEICANSAVAAFVRY